MPRKPSIQKEIEDKKEDELDFKKYLSNSLLTNTKDSISLNKS